ncbi:MAG TPA: DUF805 domain-containing protein [Luteolibacter sp.]
MEFQSPYTPPATVEPSAIDLAKAPATLDLKSVLFSFQGRIPRRTFWLASLVTVLGFAIPTALIASMLKWNETTEIIGTILLLTLFAVLLWVSLAIRVKRWHDHGKSGWWVFVSVIPYIGGLISFVVLGCLRGTVGPNAHGDDPT